MPNNDPWDRFFYQCLTLMYDSYNPTHGYDKTSSQKGNDAHLRATIQSEKKWKDQFFRCLRAANSVVCGRI